MQIVQPTIPPELLARFDGDDRQLLAGWLEAHDRWEFVCGLPLEQAGRLADMLAIVAGAGADVTVRRLPDPDGRRSRRRAREQQTDQQQAA
jgi:hypothetical protein